MPSLKANLIHFAFRLFQQLPQRQENDYKKEQKENERKPPKAPKGVVVNNVDLGGICAEKITKIGNQSRLVLYIHGGGFTTGSARQRRNLCQVIADQYGYNCIANNYRLSPEHQWPAHLVDCHKVYLALLEQGYPPKSIVLMGESAGGTLALSLALLLKAEGSPLPAAVVAFSPCTNQAEGFPSHRSNAKTDIMLGNNVNSREQYKAVFGDFEPNIEKMRNPLISPYYGEYKGMPPIFLTASDAEALYDDSVELYRKLTHEGHIVDFDVQHGLFHAYPIFPSIKESKKTLKKVFSFLEKIMEQR